jgi:hypothetical protein
MWPRAFMVRSWCDSAKSFHVVPVYTVQWQFIWRIFSFLSFINDEKIHQISYIRTQPSTLRSWCNLVKWPYGVKKISIKWLLPVKVTLEVIKRHPKVFCWSCDEDPLKWDKKNLPSIQFVITDRMSLLSPLSSNGRSIPLNTFFGKIKTGIKKRRIRCWFQICWEKFFMSFCRILSTLCSHVIFHNLPHFCNKFFLFCQTRDFYTFLKSAQNSVSFDTRTRNFERIFFSNLIRGRTIFLEE